MPKLIRNTLAGLLLAQIGYVSSCGRVVPGAMYVPGYTPDIASVKEVPKHG